MVNEAKYLVLVLIGKAGEETKDVFRNSGLFATICVLEQKISTAVSKWEK